MRDLVIVLRLVHIISGVFWVGAALVMTFFLFPALAGAGPAAGPVIAGLQRRGLLTALPVSAGLTLVSGMWLFQIASGGAPAAFARSAVGGTLGLAGVLAVAAFVLGMVVSRPAAMRAGRLSQRLATAAAEERDTLQRQIQDLQRRALVANRIVAALLIATVAGMATARYL